ncbi:hypothetical protein DPMN_122987 [Dreissena polymorpha]|uniref:Uncharacterized protein n=1 Tax=Dreissena polymorpha TaxID=45954 RepID=A0A9D4JQV3_DREPO|nr:hypothetical protein DPMN_122987 [Dreissena polymorpha]
MYLKYIPYKVSFICDIVVNIIASASANRAQPGQILADKLIQHPVEVRVAAGNKKSLKRAIRRAKRATVPAEPETISPIRFPLPESYTTTSSDSNERFLVYDNGSKTARVLVYCSRVGL